MAGRVRGILEHLLGRRLEAAVSDTVSDFELLHRFTTTRDEAAFELLVWRYGAMVLGLCRRAVRDEQLAEDAFQAVFLVLARKARSIRGRNLGGWLFRVARRVSVRAAARRKPHRPLPELPIDPQPAANEHRELSAILDAEVARLPERFRRVVILCYLGSHTTEDAARELGCPRGTVLSRLATARKRLAERLTHRGVTLPAIGVAVAERTTGRLISQTIALIQNRYPIPATSGPALLAESVVRSMATTKLATACGAVLLAAGLTFGVGWGIAGIVEPQSIHSASANESQLAQQSTQTKKTESKEIQPVESAESLRKYGANIADQIERLQGKILLETRTISNSVDVIVLQAELLALDKQILNAEKESTRAKKHLEWLFKEPEAGLKAMLEENALLTSIEDQDPIRQLKSALGRYQLQLRRLELTADPGDAELIEATKNVELAQKQLAAASEKAKPVVERRIRESYAVSYKFDLEKSKQAVASTDALLNGLLVRRGTLVERIAQTRRAEASRQVFQDHLRVLQDIQLELFRQKTLREFGIELSQPTAGTSGSDTPLRDLRREIETLRKELRPTEKGDLETQMKELRKEIDALRTEMQRLRKK